MTDDDRCSPFGPLSHSLCSLSSILILASPWPDSLSQTNKDIICELYIGIHIYIYTYGNDYMCTWQDWPILPILPYLVFPGLLDSISGFSPLL